MFHTTHIHSQQSQGAPELVARSRFYRLADHQLTATIVPPNEEKLLQEIYALRSKLFAHYIIRGREDQGDRDEFDKSPTCHVTLRQGEELIAVCRLQPVCDQRGALLPHLCAKPEFGLVVPSRDYKDPHTLVDLSRVGVVSQAPEHSVELLLGAALDLMADSGFSHVVAFTPVNILSWMEQRGILYRVISGDRKYTGAMKTSENNPDASAELVVSSFATNRDVTDTFLNYAGGSRTKGCE